MANLDELYSQIPTQQIASMLGADPGEVDNAVKTLVPALVGSLHHHAQDADGAANIAAAAGDHAASGLLDGGVNVDQVDQNQGNQEISRIFGGNDSSQVASALAGAGAGNSALIQRMLPLLAPIVLAYVGKQLTHSTAGAGAPGGGGLGSVLGGLLGGGSAGGAGGLGSILSGVLGGQQGGAIGQVLGNLLGKK